MTDFSEFDEFSIMKAPVDNNKLPTNTEKNQNPTPSNRDKMVDATVENFGRIIDTVQDLVQIKKMKVQSDAILRKMAEDRKTLLAEAEAYAQKKNADTKSVVERMNVVRMMMKDFYEANNGNITSEDFRAIITETINQMGRL